MRPGNAGKPTCAALKSIKTGAVSSCHGIHALSGLRCAGFEHHPSASGTATIVLGWGMAPLEWAMCAFSVVTACVVLLRLMSALGSLFGPSGDAA
jgi:hypothetical protein